ncbi:hypothetical protein [Brachybacterium vulturis]|uniref:hypothetical protein n=1 Tax=Brachybacterium vulturis TaxID=2017484 RepID=UPI001FE8E6E8|nr:hypothetical protein [Brachybacterium vulturis]
MNAQNRPPRQQPVRRTGMPPRPDPSARRGSGIPRAPRRAAPWAPGQRPLEGKVHAPFSTTVVPRRRRGRWLTHGVPTVLAGVVGLSSFITLGVSSLVGGAGLLGPLLAGLGIAAVVGGGSAFLLRNRAPRPVRLGRSTTEIPAATRTMLEKVVKDSRQQRRRLQRMQRRARGSTVSQILHRAETLLLRIDALLDSAAIQSRRASDADVMLLEGMADRYVPDLVDALEDTVGFLDPTTTEGARERAIENLHSIDEQLTVLAGSIDRLENDIVAGVSRSLDVHSEFLRARFPEPSSDPFIDR